MDARMTPEELEQIAESERAAQGQFTQRVNVCMAAGCLSCQSQTVKDALDQEVARRGTKDHCQVKGVGCMGLCSEGPLVTTSVSAGGEVQHKEVLYKKVEAADGAAILDSLEGEPVSRLVCRTDVPFFQRQKKIVLENSGAIDPERIEDYVPPTATLR
jgi:bidirectional [NiFe] hydrogenase diaphorase subunit